MGAPRRGLIVGLVSALIIGAGLLVGPAVAADRTTTVAESTARTDRVIIRWADEGMAAARAPSSVGRLNAMAAALGGGRHVSFLRPSAVGGAVYSLDRSLGRDAPRILAALRRVPGVVSVEPDRWRTIDALPNDTYAGEMWGLLGPADGSPYGIDAVSAWRWTRGKTALVAVIDTGLRAHPDLGCRTDGDTVKCSRAVLGYDFVEGKPGGWDPGDWGCGEPSSWHGTHVAGTIAALANNKRGVFGGAPEARVLPVRVLGPCGGFDDDIINGMIWAAGGDVPGVPANPTPARVLNLSLGGDGECPADWVWAISYVRSLGALPVVAAGNSNQDAGWETPANCPGAFTVAATNEAGKRAKFSNYGPLVDLAAPGVGILSTIDEGGAVPLAPTYGYYSGTSMAAPHVSLSAALLLADHPNFTPDDMEAWLKGTAVEFAPDSSKTGCPKKGCGTGIVNPANMFAALRVNTPTAPLNVKAVAGDGSAAVSWGEPASTGGAPITGYVVKSSPGSMTCTSKVLSCTISDLANGTSYTFRAWARNKIGRSEPSAFSKPVVPADTTAPAVVVPKVTILAGQQLAATVKVRLNWPAASDPSGIARYELQFRLNDGSWSKAPLSSPTALKVVLALKPGSSYRFRLRARDGAGNIGKWVTTASAVLRRLQEKAKLVSYTAKFNTAALSGASGGSVSYTGVAKQTATFKFTGTSVAFVSTLAANRGIAELWLDGKKVATVDLYKPATQTAIVVWARRVAAGKHTLEVRVTGDKNAKSKGKRVDIDAFLFWR